MGTDYTSFSRFTQGWSEDPSTVTDSQGRQVLLMEKPRDTGAQKPVYGPLMHNGYIILDEKNEPVRDIPGLPLTLSTTAKGWFIEGLRRCLGLKIKE